MGSLDSTVSNMSSSVAEFKTLDPELFRKQAHQMVDFIADYYKSIETYPVLTRVEPGYLRSSLPDSAPNRPESLDTILQDVKRDIVPGLTHWMSPSFFGYFAASGSTAGFLGEMLCSCFNTVGFNWLASPAATELEMVVMDWLAKMLKLPTSFMFSGTGGGVILGNTTESILVTLVAARDRALADIGVDNVGKLAVYCSDETHTSFLKACKLAGISNVRSVPTKHETLFSMQVPLLREAVESDVAAGLVPLYLCATVGTTSTAAYDDVERLADVAGEFGMWLHVDAAYAGTACICPEFRHYIDGVERADSMSLNAHKWLLTGADCCCLFVKTPKLLVKALNMYPEYLKNKASETKSVVDYMDWQVGTSRRFRSLRLWLVLRSYGVANLHDHVRSDVGFAKKFEEYVKSDPRFEIVVPRWLTLVCFRLNPVQPSDPGEIESLNRKLLEWVNATGQVYMTHTVVGGTYMLRFAVGATLTEERHVDAAWNLVKNGADHMMLKLKEVLEY